MALEVQEFYSRVFEHGTMKLINKPIVIRRTVKNTTLLWFSFLYKFYRKVFQKMMSLTKIDFNGIKNT